MNKNQYLIRLDDACPTMNADLWNRMEDILDRYGVKPMVGIIPHNEDPLQLCSPENKHFWDKVTDWKKKGWAIALHGYNHCYTSTEAGINPLWNRSEFAGLPLEEQKKKISKGVKIFRANGLEPEYFFAPSHTFDLNTLKALQECSNIRIISDTIATRPYRRYDFVFIPQLGGHCTEMKIKGIWTFCLHPSTMTQSNIEATEKFIAAHKDEFITFDNLDLNNINGKDLFSRFLSWAYFTQRKIRGNK